MGMRFRPDWLERHRVDTGRLARTDVVGIGHVLVEVDALAARLRDPARAAAMGVEPPRGILFWGDPGTGKTLTARYLAASLGEDVPFYELSADELTPERIRGALRYLAARHPRCVVYLDEIDTFGMSRDYGGHDPETRLLLTATLAALDGLLPTGGPVVVASSNREPGFLDRALTRSGRLGIKVHFDPPDEEERIALFALFTRLIPTEQDIDWRHAARLTRGKTPADVRALVDDAAGLAMAAGRDRLSEDDVLEAIRRDGRIEPLEGLGPDVRSRIAIHEGGHVAAAVVLRGPAWVSAVRIGQFDGATSVGDEALDAGHWPDGDVRASMVVSFAGIAAEVACLGEGTQDGRFDVSNATAAALARIESGLTGIAAPIHYDHLGRNVAESLKEALAQGMAEPIAEAQAAARAIVAANVEPIRRFAGLLDAAGELTGEALRSAIDEAGFLVVVDARDLEW